MTEGSDEQQRDLEGLTTDQLQAQLAKAKDELDDVDEMRRFTLGQTGVHIGASRLRSLNATWARDEARLRERIRLIQELLTP